MNVPPLRHFGGSPTRVLIAGGGVGAVESLLALRALARERVSITVLSPTREWVYKPLSVVEPFGGGATPRFDLAQIAIDRGARLHMGLLDSVDAERGCVLTLSGEELRYDVLILAVGARRMGGIPGAISFGGPDDSDRFAALLSEAELGLARRIVFAVPPEAGWALPLYELALNTAAHLDARDVRDVELTLVTPESSPLGVFGPPASDEVRRLLEGRGIALRTDTYPAEVGAGKLSLVPHGELEADRVVTLPWPDGPYVRGLPHDEAGFIPVDAHCMVDGLANVYAVGDATNFPIKQGGITAEQADTAAEAIASRAGAPVTPRPFRPVLRGLLLTGDEPRYLSASITRGPVIASEAEVEPLWWPATKVPGRFIASYLQERGKSVASPPSRQEAATP